MMNRLTLALMATCISFNAVAMNDKDIAYSLDSDCSKLNIQISNQTSSTCTLKANYIHGNLTHGSAPPRTLIPGGSGQFLMDQTLLGPNVDVHISCGDNTRSITLNSQQNFCLLMAGNINTQIYNPRGLVATPVKHEGSWFWSRHGSLIWDLREITQEP